MHNIACNIYIYIYIYNYNTKYSKYSLSYKHITRGNISP